MQIQFKPLEIGDAEQFFALVNEMKDEGTYLFSTLRFPFEDTKTYIAKHVEVGSPIWGAFDGEKLVGWIDYNRGNFPEIEHIASLGMGLKRDYRGKGLGKALLGKCLESAKEGGIVKMELEVFASNTVAEKLYRKSGFVEEGRKVRGRKFNGKYEDLICMYKML